MDETRVVGYLGPEFWAWVVWSQIVAAMGTAPEPI